MFGSPWQRDPLTDEDEGGLAPSIRMRLASARRSAAAPATTPEVDAASDGGTVYVVMPDETFCIGEKTPSPTQSGALKSPSGGTTEEPSGGAPVIGATADEGDSATRGSGTGDTLARHSTEVARREGGVLWGGAPVAPRGWLGDQFVGMWPGAFEAPMQNLWAVGVVGGHVQGVYPVEVYGGSQWAGPAPTSEVPWDVQDGPAAGSSGVDIELPPLRSGLEDSDTVHDTTVHASTFQMQHASPFQEGSEPQETDQPSGSSPASEPSDEAGWSRDLYGGEPEPARLASHSSYGEWNDQDQAAQAPAHNHLESAQDT